MTIPPAGPGAPAPTTAGPQENVLILHCPNRPGILATISRMLFEAGANIEEHQQFDDAMTSNFFMRIRFSVPEGGPGLEDFRGWMEPLGTRFAMRWQIWSADAPYRTIIMASKSGHCLNDLLFRWRTGGIKMEVAAVVSNHTDLEPLARPYGVPFHHIPITAQTRPAAEARLLDLVVEGDIQLVVLARYMQVLSDELCRTMSGRIINIHHSFLPSFKGGRPYHQAFDRGVKLVGATAHYVTADLDEGPIIEQDVVRVDHRMSPEDLVRAGQDCESQVLTRAVRWHCQSRVILNRDRTVVFS